MKKLLSLILAVFLLVSLIPVSAFALEGDPILTLTTDFSTTLQVGQTFTVTARLDNVAAINGMQMMLKWNSDAVAFKGFVLDGDYLDGDFWGREAPTYNNELGAISWGKATDLTNKSGSLFTANFEIIGEGALGIGLEEGDDSEGNPYFKMACVEGVLTPTIDVSGLLGLTVGGKVVGAPVPDELVTAGVAAMSTDKGAVLGYECLNDYLDEDFAIDGGNGASDAPVYLVKIPEGAEEVYIQYSIPLEHNMVGDEKWPSTTYGLVEEEAYEGEERILYSAADMTDGTAGMSCVEYKNQTNNEVTIPLVMDIVDWYGNIAGQFAVLKTDDESYANLGCTYDGEGFYTYFVVGNQSSAGNKPIIAYFAFEYGAASEDDDAEPTYTITVNETTGGTVTVCDANMNEITEAVAGASVYLQNTPAEGYRLVHYLIDGATVTEAELGMVNGCYTMPEKDVVISAVFELIPPATYAVNINAADNGTVTADKDTAAAGEKVTLTVAPVTGYELDTLIVKQGDDEIEVVNNEFTMPAGAVTVSATFKKVVAGYQFATSADVSAENGGTAVVKVMITGHSDPNVTKYNAYDITLTYDSEKLEYQDYDGAVKSDNGRVEVDEENGTIRIVGCGADKDFGTEIAALTFKTKAEGEATVTIDKVQVSDKEESVKEDAPEATPKHDEDDTGADETPDVSVIVVPYSVTKPDFISGNDKVLHGESYTFSYTDTTNYTYADLTVTVGGTEVTPTKENGVYTIAGVTGAIEITATQTPNSYDVTKPENVTGPDKATYGTPYIFTVTPSAEDMAIDTVTVKYADGNEVPCTINENGEYVIAGTDITGAFTITVTEKEKMTTITFTGIETDEIDGGQLTMAAEIGKDFTFKLIKKEGFDYIVKIGETELTESEEVAGQYTIPAEQVVKGGVTVTIEKVDNTTATVDVTEYINLDGKTMFLVTAKWGEKVLAYGEGNTMFWSDKYTVTGEEEAGAYCWLVVSTDEMNTVDLVKAAAKAAIVEAAEDATATVIKYDYDINGTTKVDVNDAQLAYDMYNASYMDFTDNLPMLKFLEADVKTDSKLDTQDVAAIISFIVSGANA